MPSRLLLPVLFITSWRELHHSGTEANTILVVHCALQTADLVAITAPHHDPARAAIETNFRCALDAYPVHSQAIPTTPAIACSAPVRGRHGKRSAENAQLSALMQRRRQRRRRLRAIGRDVGWIGAAALVRRRWTIVGHADVARKRLGAGAESEETTAHL